MSRYVLATILAASALCLTGASGDQPDLAALRARAEAEQKRGMHRDAAALYRQLCLSPDNVPGMVGEDVKNALECYTELGAVEDMEPLLDRVAAQWADSWQVMAATAALQIELPSLVAWESGSYVRSRDWNKQLLDASERDRVVALQRMRRAVDLLPADAAPADRLALYRQFAAILRHGRTDGGEWRLTTLTDVDTLPEPDEHGGRYRRRPGGAPVDADGQPVFYRQPARWEDARSDGERWRWLLAQQTAAGGGDQAVLDYAEFLYSQFGVHTMAWYSPARSGVGEDDTGPLAVRTLSEGETIARLATGIKRFSLPDEHNFIRIFRSLNGTSVSDAANQRLARLFENRQQYPRAVSFWERLSSASVPDSEVAAALKRLTGKTGSLQPGGTVPAGTPATLSYIFRNGSTVRLQAQRLDQGKLLDDIRVALRRNDREALRTNPSALRPDQIGLAAIKSNQQEYVRETVAEWDFSLPTPPDHLSSRVDIPLPFSMAGCYLITATMDGGNVSRCVVWLADLALTSRTIPNSRVWFVADPTTGRPVPDATVTTFTFTTETESNGARPIIKASERAAKTDANGLVVIPVEALRSQEVLTIARTEDGRMAYYGFDHLWGEPVVRSPRDEPSAYVITDRPAYRPDQTVHFQVWLGQAGYGSSHAPSFAGRTVTVTVTNPRGETIATIPAVIGQGNGVSGKVALDANAVLGMYSISVDDITGGVSFRVEEYKKPEFEVTVTTPDTPIRLGDTATVSIAASYYYGAPVTDAAVSYTVTRTPHTARQFPPWRWDWLYGEGAWYRQTTGGWRGGVMPAIWPPQPVGPPEVVLEGEGRLSPDGTLRLAIDTLPAKELFGDSDHQYSVQVEVRDQSRRTITGSGTVIAARRPFSVSVWADRGWYNAGDRVVVTARATLPSGGGAAATGVAVLHRLNVDVDGAVQRTEVSRHDLATDDQGNGTFSFAAPAAGQYLMAVSLAGASGGAVEESVLLAVRGTAEGQGEFHYADLEVVPDKRDYAPGEIMRLAVNSSRPDATVLLFIRPESGDLPILVQLKNGTAVVDVPIGEGDQPNFFCEALTVSGGRVRAETREIFVPPAPKSLSVTVDPDKPDYRPGETATFTVTVHDSDGRPVEGDVVVTMYDRSIEYISGGPNVPAIQGFFWDWRRSYFPRAASSLSRNGYTILAKGDVQWEPIGVFGRAEADWNDGNVYAADDMVMIAEAEPASAPMAFAASDMGPPHPAPAQEARSKAGMAMATGGREQAFAEPSVRSNFADTAVWAAGVRTGRDGTATVTAVMPDTLTAWKIRAWSMASGTRVGETESSVETKKNIVVRPQAPRFLTQTDRVILSANLHNYLPRAKKARAELVVEGGVLHPADGARLVQEFDLAAGDEARADWPVIAQRPGEAVVIMKLLTDEESDAAEIRIPVLVHGTKRVEQLGGTLRRSDTESRIRFTIPERRLADQSRLELSVSGSIAAQLLDALPYLIDYPYGCTEQTLNRFLPVVVIRNYLDRMGLALKDAKPFPAASHGARAADPVFDSEAVDALVREGVERLAAMQVADGGWGWFSGLGERSYPHTTAVVVHGLLGAKDAGAALPSGMLERGLDWLRAYRQEQVDQLQARQADSTAGKEAATDMDAFVHMILMRAGYTNPAMRDFLYRDRLGLSPTGLSMLGLALHEEGATMLSETVLGNLSQYVHGDPNGTAWLERGSSAWWYWYNDPVETQAWYLMLLSRVDPQGDVASGLAKYLLANRKNGGYWRSTRDTAYAIDALTEYAAASGETTNRSTVAVYYDGVKVMERELTPDTLLADNRFILDGVAVEAGSHELRIERTGEGPVYFGGTVGVFSLEDPIHAAQGDLAVTRRFYRLHREARETASAGASGRAETVQSGGYRREVLPDPFTNANAPVVQSGDLVEVELTITTKNDYEYLVFEDMKAAGLEALEVQSGYAGNRLGAYVEYRDKKVVLFLRWLPRGTHTISYRFRAEAPGRFSALPTVGGGMYAPELVANSNEMKLHVTE